VQQINGENNARRCLRQRRALFSRRVKIVRQKRINRLLVDTQFVFPINHGNKIVDH